MRTRYVIECRDSSGKLDFSGVQPESAFGIAAITGIGEDEMAKIVFRLSADATLTGENIEGWPSFVDPRWRARVKTW